MLTPILLQDEAMVQDSGGPKRPVHIDKELLAILCCPETKLEVSLAEDSLVEKLNDAVSRGTLKNKANKPVTEPLDGGLIRADRKILYPIREDIPIMLIEEGIPLDELR
ncbi:MAG TPA: Trm112 family protein [Nitrospira sp.]|nr:Trm112 family protein [Nitrospira sp.]